MPLQWLSASLLTGRDIDFLPGLEPQGTLDRVLSDASTMSVTLNITDKTPDTWESAIRPSGAILACYNDAVPTRPIIWAGYVPEEDDEETTGVASDAVDVSLTSFEGVFDRAYVGDVTFPVTSARNDIIATLVNSWFRIPTGITYLRLAYTAGQGTKPVEPMVLQNADNATVKDRLDQVIGQLGGEYTVEWAWGADGQSIVPTLYFGDRIGQAVQTGLGPRVTFTLPGSVTNIQRTRSYTKDNGARKLVYYSSGQGDTTPYSDPVFGPDDGRPLFEFRHQPAPNLSPAKLKQYAQQAAPVITQGLQSIALTASTVRAADTGHLYGVDWRLGDDIGYSIQSEYVNEQGAVVKLRKFPQGLSGVGRCTAVSIDPAAMTITPSLADKTVYTQGDQVS